MFCELSVPLINVAQFLKDYLSERRRSLSQQFTHPADGRVGGGEGARGVLQPSLSAGLMDAFCLLARLSVYNSTICLILVDTPVRTLTQRKRDRDRDRRREADEMVAQSQRRLS